MGGNTAGVASVTPAAVLDRVLDEILVDESAWCQGASSLTAHNDIVMADSKHAAKFCMVGAIRRSACDLLEISMFEANRNERFWDVTHAAEAAVGGVIQEGSVFPVSVTIPQFNDDPHTTFEDVRLVVKEAREKVNG